MTACFGDYYRGRRVLLTGHTGFKGSWLAHWLAELGAEVVGLALDPPSDPSHFEVCGGSCGSADLRIDIRDEALLARAVAEHAPEIVFHLAAQPIVRRAFEAPRETFEINVMGTVNLLEAVRRQDSVRAVVVATSDKAYRDVGSDWPYRESDALGGHEPYAGSKAAAEIVVEVYQSRRFQANAEPAHDVAIATGRAGNVIGGGDWAADRLLPDITRAIASGRDIHVRSPRATRPWQHVLDCLAGYLQLGARLASGERNWATAWNFGPSEARMLCVAEIVERVLAAWPGHGTRLVIDEETTGKESQVLRVDSSRAIHHLGWSPCWNVDRALGAATEWYREHAAGNSDMRTVTRSQIAAFVEDARQRHIAWAID